MFLAVVGVHMYLLSILETIFYFLKSALFRFLDKKKRNEA